jgi:hypothetical protein
MILINALPVMNYPKIYHLNSIHFRSFPPNLKIAPSLTHIFNYLIKKQAMNFLNQTNSTNYSRELKIK